MTNNQTYLMVFIIGFMSSFILDVVRYLRRRWKNRHITVTFRDKPWFSNKSS